MEESKKRKERLKAIRTGAAQAEGSNNGETFSSPGLLSNPLLEASATPPVHNEFSAAPRFDFYTDPMAAFSGDRKNMPPKDQFASPGFRSPQMTPPPSRQYQSNLSPIRPLYQAQGLHHMPCSYMTPPQRHFPLNQGAPGVWNGSAGSAGYNYRQNSPRVGNFSPNFAPSSPGFSSNQVMGQMIHSPSSGSGWRGSPISQRGSPNPSQNGSAGSAGYNYRQNSPRVGNFSPNFAPSSLGFSSNQVMGQMIHSPSSGSGWRGSPISQRGSPNPYSVRGSLGFSGRGRGQRFGNSPNQGSPNQGNPNWGRGGGRGRGSHAQVSAKNRPEMFYHKSMMEDPWENLIPVIWKSHTPASWLPKSIGMKKPKVSETHKESSSKPSLADYLAASFHDATDETPTA